jgi:hypothetical protein
MILLFLGDIHGPAMLPGVLIALILIRLNGDRFQRLPGFVEILEKNQSL